MKRSSLAKAAAWLGAWLMAAPSACDTGGIVGGECRAGRIICDNNCVDPASDPNHCGSCAVACAAEQSCIQGECVGAGSNAEGGTPGVEGGYPGVAGYGSGAQSSRGGSAGESQGASAGDTAAGGMASGGDSHRGGASGTGGTSAKGGASATGGAGAKGGTSGVAGASEVDAGAGGEAGAACLPPFNSARRCGACDIACAEPTPWCVEDGDGGHACAPTCPDGFTQCDDECVDTMSSATNCGRCNNVCPSLRCIDGACSGATPGHVALYCMDYYWAEQRTAHAHLLGNAVFLLPPSTNVRILAFTRYTPSSVRAQVKRVVGWEAARFGRSYTIDNVGSAAQVGEALSVQNYDVFLIYEQPDAPAGTLSALGATMRASLGDFVVAGGVVIVLDGAQGSGEMPSFIDSSGLFALNGHVAVPSDAAVDFAVQSRTDQLANGVVSPFSSTPYSCTFDTSAVPSSDVSFVVTAAGQPVVIHRVIEP